MTIDAIMLKKQIAIKISSYEISGRLRNMQDKSERHNATIRLRKHEIMTV